MKKHISIFVALLLIVHTVACDNEEDISDVTTNCLRGKVIGKIRSAGGGLAVSLSTPYEGAVDWQGEKNVIELCNIPEEYKAPGTIIFFTSREAELGDCGMIITADGDESIEVELYGEKFSNVECPQCVE